MNREIKFRAWDKEGKDFLEDVSILDLLHRINGAWDDHEWMQFTGLKDKNGKEIYEGDVVKNNDKDWEIYYDEGAFRMRQNLGGNLTLGKYLLMGEPQHSEIIGNIYENSDLIPNPK